MFLDLARTLFGGSYPEAYLDRVENGLLRISPHGDPQESGPPIEERMLLDYLIQLNIVETRTRLHLSFLAPAYYSLAGGNKKNHVGRILSVLFNDEGSHIGYTARLIDEIVGAEDVERVAGIYACRLSDYNQHTIEHCDNAKTDYGQGRFPALFDD